MRDADFAEVTDISPFGVWILVNDKEYFLSYNDFPFFEGVSIRALAVMEIDAYGNLHWPELDIDLEIDSIENPEKYPLIYQK